MKLINNLRTWSSHPPSVQIWNSQSCPHLVQDIAAWLVPNSVCQQHVLQSCQILPKSPSRFCPGACSSPHIYLSIYLYLSLSLSLSLSIYIYIYILLLSVGMLCLMKHMRTIWRHKGPERVNLSPVPSDHDFLVKFGPPRVHAHLLSRSYCEWRNWQKSKFLQVINQIII